jgi:hypothetical protein
MSGKPITKPTPKIDPVEIDGEEAAYRASHVAGVVAGTAIRLASFRATDTIAAIGVEMISIGTSGVRVHTRICIAKDSIPILIEALEAHRRATPEDPKP